MKTKRSADFPKFSVGQAVNWPFKVISVDEAKETAVIECDVVVPSVTESSDPEFMPMPSMRTYRVEVPLHIPIGMHPQFGIKGWYPYPEEAKQA